MVPFLLVRQRPARWARLGESRGARGAEQYGGASSQHAAAQSVAAVPPSWTGSMDQTAPLPAHILALAEPGVHSMAVHQRQQVGSGQLVRDGAAVLLLVCDVRFVACCVPGGKRNILGKLKRGQEMGICWFW